MEKNKRRKRIILYIIAGLFSLPLVFLFYNEIKATIFVTFFIVGNIVLSAYKRDFQLPIEIEILTLGIVLCTINYGLKAGMLIAIFGTVLSSAFYGYYSPFLVPMVIGNVIAAFLVPYVPLPLFWLGVLATFAKNMFVFVFYHFVFNYDISKNLMYSISNILVNLVLFLNIAPFLARVM